MIAKCYMGGCTCRKLSCLYVFCEDSKSAERHGCACWGSVNSDYPEQVHVFVALMKDL